MKFTKWTHVLVECHNTGKVLRTNGHARELGRCRNEPKYKHFALQTEVDLFPSNLSGVIPEGQQYALTTGETLYYQSPESSVVYLPCTVLEVFFRLERQEALPCIGDKTHVVVRGYKSVKAGDLARSCNLSVKGIEMHAVQQNEEKMVVVGVQTYQPEKKTDGLTQDEQTMKKSVEERILSEFANRRLNSSFK